MCLIMTLAHMLMIDQGSYGVFVTAGVLQGVVNGMAVAQGPAIIYEAVGLDVYPHAMGLVNVMYGVGDVMINIFGGESLFVCVFRQYLTRELF